MEKRDIKAETNSKKEEKEEKEEKKARKNTLSWAN